MKTIFATTLAAAVMVAAPALAQTKPMPGAPVGNALTYTLDAEVGAVCGIYGNGGQSLTLDFGDLAAATSDVSRSANVAYRCNTIAGFSREISSANGGMLVRQGSDTLGSNRIAYRFEEAVAGLGDRSLIVRNQPLSTAVKSDHAGSQAFLTGTSSTQTFIVPNVGRTGSASLNGAPGTTVFAGDYADTVTVSITAK
jgi:spore coat protein U-like protein